VQTRGTFFWAMICFSKFPPPGRVRPTERWQGVV